MSKRRISTSKRRVKISSFLSERKDRFKPQEANKLGLKRVNKIDFSGNIHLVEHKPTRTNMILVKKGDLLISGINAEKGAIAVYEYDEDAIATIHYSSYSYDKSKIDIEYLKWFLKSNVFKQILIDQAGNGIKSELKPKKFLPLEIDLPSLTDQKKMVKRLQAIEQELEDLNELNERNESLINKLRQSFLHDAVQGKLTEEWRKGNPDAESANVLLDRIKAEKYQLIKEKILKREKILPEVTQKETFFELPEKWTWARFGNVIRFMAYGTSQKTNEDSNNVPVFRMGNITSDGKLDLNNFKYISPEHKDLPKLYLDDGDLIFNRTNSYELVGKSAVYNQGPNKYTLASYLIKVTPFTDYVDSYYLNNYIISPFCRKEQIEPQITAQTNQANFSGSKLKNIILPLPPLEEQKVIVEKVEYLLSHCDELEKQITTNKENAEKLMQYALSEVLGQENRIISKQKEDKEVTKAKSRTIKYDSKTTFMELVELLKNHGKLHAEDLWKMSKQYDSSNISESLDKFYSELKKQVEEEKTIKEVKNEKGYLELA